MLLTSYVRLDLCDLFARLVMSVSDTSGCPWRGLNIELS